MKKYKMGEVSKMLNIPPETIRSLERMGLLSPGKKEGSNYRFYDLQDISQILNYKRYRQMGFSSAKSIRILMEGSQTELLRMLEEKGREVVLLSGGHLLERFYQHRLRGVGFLPQAPRHRLLSPLQRSLWLLCEVLTDLQRSRRHAAPPGHQRRPH